MNKSELVDALALKTGMTKADASRAVAALFSPDEGIIAGSLRRGGRVQITGFGTFQAKSAKARTGRNPRTGEVLTIPSKTVPSFRAGVGLKDAMFGGGPSSDPKKSK